MTVRADLQSHRDRFQCTGCKAQGVCMCLPEGHRCGDCYAFRYCEKLFGCKPESAKCDWYPIRFKQAQT